MFSWQLLLDKNPSRVNLLTRRVLDEPTYYLCVFFGEFYNSIDRLFFTCVVAYKVWYKIFRWLGGGGVGSPKRYVVSFLGVL